MMTTQLLRTSAEHFEAIYAEAQGDIAAIPWADGHPSPSLVNWLNAVAPSLVRCGGRVAVVGCGLGEDARELISRGYDVLAFDCSETAITWARSLDPEHAASYAVADVFNLPSRWWHRFDLVVEINTLQAMSPELPDGSRLDAVACMAKLLARHGHLLVICRAASTPVTADEGPPWPIPCDELRRAASDAGLVEAVPISVFDDDEAPPVRRMRAVFRRGD
jgi:SAM-dependent methyltransferase